MEIQDFLTYPNRSVVSVGQALTNACDMYCPHCYSRSYSNAKVGIKECELILKAFPNIKEINFGTGETYLNSDFLDIFRFYHKKGIRLALTTNGNTLNKMSDKEIATFLSDIDFSLDFPRSYLHDKWRGVPGAFANVIKGIQKSKKLGLNTSIALALTNRNYRYLPEFSEILDRYDTYLRINIYKPVHNQYLALSYEEFWESVKLMAKHFGLMGVSEPIFALIADKTGEGSPCGHSLRIHTDLSIGGCVYISNQLVETKKFIKMTKHIPRFCRKCKVVKYCKGGCASRRILQSDVDKPDFTAHCIEARKFQK